MMLPRQCNVATLLLWFLFVIPPVVTGFVTFLGRSTCVRYPRLDLLSAIAFREKLAAERAGGDHDSIIEGSQLKGKHRRFLRALAGRMKAEKSLHTLQQADPEPSEGFLAEVESSLRAHELVNIRVLFATRKKEVKDLGAVLAARAQAELVQVLGHTYLLYKQGIPARIDLKEADSPRTEK